MLNCDCFVVHREKGTVIQLRWRQFGNSVKCGNQKFLKTLADGLWPPMLEGWPEALPALQPGPWGSHCPGQAGMGPGSQCCVLLTWHRSPGGGEGQEK